MKRAVVVGLAILLAGASQAFTPVFANEGQGVVPVVKNPVSMVMLQTATDSRDGKPTVIRFVPERLNESAYRGVGLNGSFRMVVVEKKTERGPNGSVQRFELHVQDAFGRTTANATYFPLSPEQSGCAYSVSIENERFCSRSGVLELDGVMFSFWDR